MSKNVPITFTWRALVQDHDWPERSTDKKIPSGVQIMAVAFALERHSDADGRNVYPSVGTIADLARVSPATVRKVLQVMRDQKFLRPDGQGRHQTVKYRLIYPSLSSQIDPAGSISTTKSRQTTNRTELPSAHSSPDGDIVAPSANAERSVSVPKVEVDRAAVERKAIEFLRPFLERGEHVSFPEDRTLAEKFYDDGLNDIWQSFTRTSVLSDMIRFMESLGWTDSPYEEIVSVLSGECHDKKNVKAVMNDLEDRVEYSLSNALSWMTDFYCQWRSECEDGWFLPNGDRNDDKLVPDLGWNDSWGLDGRVPYWIEKFIRLINDSRDRVMSIRANAGSVSVSATNTGSDRMIVEKIVETVSEKVEVKGLERW